jgi:hypothetical protein
MPVDENEDVPTVLARMERKIEGLEARLDRQVPMTPGRAAAEARASMRAGYQQAADERERQAAEGGGEAA